MRVMVRDETTAGEVAGQREVALGEGPATLRELIRSRVREEGELAYAAAVRAFERGHLLVVVDGRQREDLDEALELGPDSDVAFVRLVPLIGG